MYVDGCLLLASRCCFFSSGLVAMSMWLRWSSQPVLPIFLAARSSQYTQQVLFVVRLRVTEMPKRVIKTRSSFGESKEETRQTGGRTGWILAIGCATCACDILRIEKECASDSHRISFFLFSRQFPFILVGISDSIHRDLALDIQCDCHDLQKTQCLNFNRVFLFFSSLLILSLYFVGYYRNEHDDNI